MKFTFKKEPRETGLMSVGRPWQSVAIKLGGKEVGIIHAPDWQTKDGKWSISMMVVRDTGNPNCDWTWVRIKQRFDDEASSRQWVKDNADRLVALKLHQEEPYE